MSTPSTERPLQLFCLGADSGEHLVAEAVRLHTYVAEHRPSLAQLSDAMRASPAHGPHRLALLAANVAQVQTQLRAVQKGGIAEGAMRHVVPAGKQPKVAMLFCGHGSHYLGMGRALFATQPVFRQAMLACEDHLSRHLGGALTEKLYGQPPVLGWLDAPKHSLAALFSVQYSLAQLWRALGVHPAYVMGYSAGEIAAAAAAGVLQLGNAIDVLMTRIAFFQSCPGDGATAQVFAAGDDLATRVAAHPNVGVAAYHGGDSAMVAGPKADLDAFLAACQDDGVAAQCLTVHHAVHSPWLDPVMPQLRAALEKLPWPAPRGPTLPWVSNVHGALQAPDEALNAAYWCEQIRRPVQFARGMQTLAQAGVDVFIEVGPNAGMIARGRQCLPARRHVWLASMRRDAPECKTLLESAGVLHTCGVALDPHFWRIVS